MYLTQVAYALQLKHFESYLCNYLTETTKFACIAISVNQWIPSPIQGRAHEFWMTLVGENMASLKNLKSS